MNKKDRKTELRSKLMTDAYLPWLKMTRHAQRTTENDVRVECGACRACCTSSYFIHIRPDETDTLKHIPKNLLFPAPGLPKGHVVMGYDKNGHCPMFKNNECSIYEHRPQTCRTYDCRIFPATGLFIGKDKPEIQKQAERWEFQFPYDDDSEAIKAVQSAARFITKYSAYFPAGFIPANITQQAVLAIKIFSIFHEESYQNCPPNDYPLINEIVESVLNAYKKFEAEKFV